MSFIVDTCGWIECLTEGPLANKFAKFLQQTNQLLVPTIVQYELYKWIYREKGEALALDVIGVIEQSQVISINSTLALIAAEVSIQHNLAMADAIIYACGQMYTCQIITSDKHFKNLPNVVFYEK